MQHKLSYQLRNNQEILIDKTELDYTKKKDIITFEDEYGLQIIDLKTKKYTKNNQEYTFIVDFIKKICNIVLETSETCTFNIECSMKISEKKIIITYTIEEKLNLEINLKGE